MLSPAYSSTLPGLLFFIMKKTYTTRKEQLTRIISLVVVLLLIVFAVLIAARHRASILNPQGEYGTIQDADAMPEEDEGNDSASAPANGSDDDSFLIR